MKSICTLCGGENIKNGSCVYCGAVIEAKAVKAFTQNGDQKIICDRCGGENSKNSSSCAYCFVSIEKDVLEAPAKFGYGQIEQKSEDIFSRLKDFLSPESLETLGKLRSKGVGLEKNIVLAEELLIKSALMGDKDSMLALGWLYLENERSDEDKERAFWWFVQAAQLGSVEGQNILALNFGGKLVANKDSDVFAKNREGGRLEQLVGKVRPFCVTISCWSAGQKNASAGSGVIVSPKHIITNQHVIYCKHRKREHQNIVLSFHPSLKLEDCKLRVVCSSAEKDIAICEFEDTLCKADYYPAFADSHKATVGSDVFTYGNPLGGGLFLSTGTIAKEVEQGTYGNRQIIHTNMSINGGNSGGGLFDFSGNLLGLMTFTPRDYSDRRVAGMSGAVSSNTILEFAAKNNIRF